MKVRQKLSKSKALLLFYLKDRIDSIESNKLTT